MYNTDADAGARALDDIVIPNICDKPVLTAFAVAPEVNVQIFCCF